MSKIALVLISILLAGKSYAQQDYFILVQADNNQPFYVLRGDKSFPSSPQGHLILGQLKEGDDTIIIGFPGKIFPEQQYTIPIQKMDMELQLKNLGEKGWGLFNPRTLEWRLPDKKKEPAAATGPEGVKIDDAFSRLMAGVVSDTAVMYNTYAMEQVLKDSPVAAVNTPPGAGTVTVQVDTATSRPNAPVRATSTQAASVTASDSSRTTPPDAVASGQTALVKTARTLVSDPPEPVTDTSAAAGPSRPHKNSIVVKLSERKTARSWRGVYTDRASGRKADTIVVIIPLLDTASGIARNRELTAPNLQSSPAQPVAVQPVPAGVEGGEAARSGTEPGEKKAPAKLVVANSDCRNFATEYDVDKLRVKLLEGGKDDDRILNARKVFRTKCFTTRQIRALSEAFTTDALKYRFFETAYPFVSDDRFGELAALLADPVYNSKFKAMTGQQ